MSKMTLWSQSKRIKTLNRLQSLSQCLKMSKSINLTLKLADQSKTSKINKACRVQKFQFYQLTKWALQTSLPHQWGVDSRLLRMNLSNLV